MSVTVVTMTAPSGYGEHADRWSIRFRYNAELVELLKSAIDWRDRSWSPDDRAWYVDRWTVCGLADELTTFGAQVQWLDSDSPCRETESSEPPPSWAQPTWAEMLMAAVGPTRRDQVFRALSRILHPDVETGDTALMAELLRAREMSEAR